MVPTSTLSDSHIYLPSLPTLYVLDYLKNLFGTKCLCTYVLRFPLCISRGLEFMHFEPQFALQKWLQWFQLPRFLILIYIYLLSLPTLYVLDYLKNLFGIKCLCTYLLCFPSCISRGLEFMHFENQYKNITTDQYTHHQLPNQISNHVLE